MFVLHFCGSGWSFPIFSSSSASPDWTSAGLSGLEGAQTGPSEPAGGRQSLGSHTQPAGWRSRGAGSCRWSGTSPVQIYSAGGRLWGTEDRTQKSAFLGGS